MYDIKQPGGKLPVPKLAGVLIILLAVMIIPVLILVGSGQPYGNTQRGGIEFVQIPQKQNNAQEIIVSFDKVTLYVPEDATDLTGNFVISPRQPELYSFASEPEWSRPIVIDIEYRNEEGVNYPGITFSKTVSICFALDPKQWDDFTQRPDDFQVQYFDEKQSPSRWVSLSRTMDPEEYQLCGQTDHFSIYALAIKISEVIPVTGATLTPSATPPPTPTIFIFNTQESRRERDSDDEPPAPNPTVTNTKPPPTQPPTQAPTQPPPTEPLPTEPLPTEPLPTEPLPTEPLPTEPLPTQPLPTEPLPTEPLPTEPLPTQPELTIEPLSTDPPDSGKPTKQPKPTHPPKPTKRP